MPTPNIFSTILSPRSLAVVGASRSPQKVGHQVLQNILASRYRGRLYPINPHAHRLNGLVCYPTLSATPTVPELALIVTPAPLVKPIVYEAAQIGVKAAIIISAGFAESGPPGERLQAELANITTNTSLRLLGPNCLGCFSTVNRLNATFGPPLPQPGDIMLISQSGALVTGILDWAQRYSLGLSHAVTLGNRIDINEVDALSFAAADPKTKIVLMYLESFANAPALFNLASRITPIKPVLLLKGGQSQAGQAASASHTASLATNYTLVKSFARQVGICLTESIQEWLTTAYVFSTCPPPSSHSLGIITNAGGPGVLATDTAIAHHLQVKPFSQRTIKRLQRHLAPIPAHNPLDILGDAPPERFLQAFSLLQADPDIASLVTIMTPQTTTKPYTTARLLAQTVNHKKPALFVLLGGQQLHTARSLLESHSLPTFTYPTEAIATLATLVWHTTHKRAFYAFPAAPVAYVSKATVKRLGSQLNTGLTHQKALDLLKAYGFSLPRSYLLSDLSSVAAAINAVGRPAVLKTAAMDLPHKAKLGGVYLGVMTAYHARVLTQKLMRLHPQVLFQQTIHSQLELILGCRRDPQLGVFITVGLGGSLTDAIADRAYAFVPAQKRYLEYVFSRTNAFKLITQKGLSTQPVVDVMHRLSMIMVDFPQIEEIEINPIMVTATRVYACDIKLTLPQPSSHLASPKRHSVA